MAKIICAIVDNVANDIAGPLQTFNHTAQAIRFFGDVAQTQDTLVAKHIHDHSLYQLGILDDDMSIITGKTLLLTGSQWAAAQMPNRQEAEAPR